MSALTPHLAAARIVQDAGGELVGRTRLQKIAFLLRLAGFDEEFSFEYRHYGPFSEDLAQAMDIAAALGPIREEERAADWGGRYSIYKLEKFVAESDADRERFVQEAKRIDAVELELAATAAYLFVHEGIGASIAGNPWHETQRRKPSKSDNGRLQRAASAYEHLRRIKTKIALPELPSP
ncbi:MAG: hypothetical protein IOC63_09475 [Methylobacterium sp.]|nr:hypothetical protein [Methylobacterium sp.]